MSAPTPETAVQPTPLPRAGSARNAPLVVYLALGVLFGIVMVKAQVVSWFRIQEMFRFQSFHMYGVMASAVAVAAGALWGLRYINQEAAIGRVIVVEPKVMGSGRRYIFGGAIFGLGWGLTGACPGPMYTLVGGGYLAALVMIVSALVGTLLYGLLRPRLWH